MQEDFTIIDREPSFAGKFYPGGKRELTIGLKGYFEKAAVPIKPGERPLAIVSPHAGYVFSGKVAASAFNQIPEDASYNRIFLIGSSHRYSFRGGAVYCRGDFLTPPGRIPVDRELGRELTTKHPVFIEHNQAHNEEHSLEVQLPFIQYRIRSGFRLIPIVLGTHHPEDCVAMAKILEKWFTPENLFIISTDFSHYPDNESAQEVDKLTANAITSNSSQELLRILAENKKKAIPGLATSLCGWTSVLTLLNITEKKQVDYQLIDYQNSGDNSQYGDDSRVVGYQAIAVFNRKEEIRLTEQEKSELIRIAREAIKDALIKSKEPKEETCSAGHLSLKMGAFVSIYCRDELRGCIGSFKSDCTLAEVVRRMAVAATCDRRFKPLSLEDLLDMHLEISVLSPLKKISSPDEIVVGRHGIYIKKDFYSGTFLPQVAASRNWSREEFLGRCSRDKAGLGWDGWKKAELFTYEALIIKEEPDSGD